MANTDLAVRIATILDSTGLKKADKAFAKFEKRTKSLGKALGVSLATAAVVSFGKATMRAFAEDEKSAALLANTVKNLGLQFSAVGVEKFVQDLSASAHVADDQLRPAMQSLLTTTGSLRQSQELLTNAIEISRGSGVDLSTVVSDLNNAYVGNTKGLKKYYLGLTQAQLKAASFATIQEKLNKQFAGSSGVFLTTYTGKMEALNVAAGEAKETIGKSLVDALFLLSGSTGVDDLTAKIDILAGKVAGIIQGFSKLGFSISAFFNPKYWKTGGGDQIWKDWEKKLAALKPPTIDPRVQMFNALQAQREKAKNDAEAAKREKERLALIAKQNAAQKALTAEQKKQATLKKAGSIFDMEQIQIIAALKGNISADERKRLELQLAIATGNVEEAKKLTYQLAISQGLTVKLAQDLASMPMANNPFAAWAGYLDSIELKAKRIIGLSGGTFTGSEDIPHGNVAPTAMSSIASGGTALGFNSAGNITINMAGSVISEDDLVTAILEGIQKRSLSGSPSSIGRIQGMFG